MKIQYLCILMLMLCSCRKVVRDIYNIEPGDIEKLEKIGFGVYMEKPFGFVKGKSFRGIQSKDMQSSISLKIDENTVDQNRKKFSEDNLKGSHLELLEASHVIYNKKDTGIFIVLKESDKIFRYRMDIFTNGKTYNFHAFCTAMEGSEDDITIRRVMKNINIGPYTENDGDLFKIALLKEDGAIIFTKDGLYPTKSPDEAVLTVKPVKGGISDKSGFLMNEILKFAKAGITLGKQNLKNGSLHTVKVSDGSKRAYGAYAESNEGGMLMVCTGNEKADLVEFEEHVRANLLNATIATK